MNQSTNESKKKLDNAFRGSLSNFKGAMSFPRLTSLTPVTVVKLTNYLTKQVHVLDKITEWSIRVIWRIPTL